MQVARRLSLLKGLKRRLGDVLLEQKGTDHRRIVEEGGVLGRGSMTVPRPDKGLSALREKLLFRQIPIAISLMERDLVVFRKASDRRLKGPTEDGAGLHQTPEVKDKRTLVASVSSNAVSQDTRRSPGWLSQTFAEDTSMGSRAPGNSWTPYTSGIVDTSHQLLECLHFFEQERRRLWHYKVGQLEIRYEKAREAAKVALDKHTRLRRSTSPAEKESHLVKSAAVDALQASRDDVRVALDDLQLVKHSLLARPYLSARLWKVLLHEDIWKNAVHYQRSCGEAGDRSAPRVDTLLMMSLAFARVSLGALHDYVQGAEISKTSPRFVVSLPSPNWRERRQQTVCTTDHHDNDDADSDPLMSMLQGAGRMAVPPLSADAVQRTSDCSPLLPSRRSARIRWAPPHSADVLPLVVDVLALHSFIVPELPVETLVKAGYVAPLLSLLVTLQKMASSTLVLLSDTPPANADEVHEMFHRLERAVIAQGVLLQDVLQHLFQTSDGPSLNPQEATQVIIGLHSLRLLRSNDHSCLRLLHTLAGKVFPQLTSNTQEVLCEKARQTSLLDFATRKHRQKLIQLYGRKGAEPHLLSSVVQQVRLQQRQMAAALREKYISDTHVRSLAQFGSAFSAYELVALFQVFSSTVIETTGMGSVSPGRLGAQDTYHRLMTATLFTAEALIVSGVMDQTVKQYSDMHDGARTALSIPISDMARFWYSLATVWPSLTIRRERQAAQRWDRQHRLSGKRALHSRSGAHTETVVMSFLIQSSLGSINSVLATRLQDIQEVGSEASSRLSKSIRPGQQQAYFNAGDLLLIASGLVELGDAQSGSGERNQHGSRFGQHTHVTAQFLRELLLRDRCLWHEVRRWDATNKEVFHRRLTECFHVMDVMDGAISQALTEGCGTASDESVKAM